MENVISARRLRKSVLNECGEVDLDLYNTNTRENYEKVYKKSKIRKDNYIITKFKTKIIFKFFLCSVILFSLTVAKMFFADNIKENNNIVRWYNHYNTHYSRGYVMEKIEAKSNRLDNVIGNIVPNRIKDYAKTKYFYSIKPAVINFTLKDMVKSLVISDKKSEYNTEENKKDNIEEKKEEVIESNETQGVIYLQSDEEVLNGIGGGEPFIQEKEEMVSSISSMDLDIELIKSKNISIVSPVKGTITSIYGPREKLFPGVSPYHTGIDIANSIGTEIYSATNGIVTRAEQGNRFFGNIIEITEKDVIFRYAHLNQIKVKVGDVIKQKDSVGTMGNTGMSTGPHLHFEIKLDDRTVDPSRLVKF